MAAPISVRIPDAADHTPRRHRVLIVDDHADIRTLVRTRLDFLPDIEVIGEAGNGEEALRLATTLAPDAVVLDCEMPGMGAETMIPLIRDMSADIRIVLYSGTPNQTVAKWAAESTPDRWVHKGRPLNELVAQLRAVLQGSPVESDAPRSA